MRTLAHISDLHFGRDQSAVVEGLLADLREQKPDLVIVSGDLTQRARRRQYAKAADFIARLPARALVIPGNHDIPLYDVVRRFWFPLERYERYITTDLRPYYEDPEIAVLGINTTRSWTWRLGGFWKDGRISEEQLLDVQRRFCSLPAEVVKVVVTHHPFIPPPGERLHGMVGGAQRALEMMESCGVDLLLAGHLHLGYSGDVRTHYEATKRSILSVQAGTAVSDRRRSEPNAYNVIRIMGPDEMSLTVRLWDGAAFHASASRRFVREESIWREQ